MERKLERYLKNYFAGATNEVRELVTDEESSVAKLKRLFDYESHLADFLKSKTDARNWFLGEFGS